ncbi:hypothetical protein TI39_contig429g00026 [Zymoseptoria brevis]|uniref:Uncharacterized protein n=1 Tax=Zymoseptoria brevis TaxID=1047168 RepID=A0A0F4GPM5_9PEZI|nr:hypothetical protein TI39_contig429g00026 [Zymoseptoria brevis]
MRPRHRDCLSRISAASAGGRRLKLHYLHHLYDNVSRATQIDVQTAALRQADCTTFSLAGEERETSTTSFVKLEGLHVLALPDFHHSSRFEQTRLIGSLQAPNDLQASSITLSPTTISTKPFSVAMAPSNGPIDVDLSQFQERRQSGRHLGTVKAEPMYAEAAAFDAAFSSKSEQVKDAGSRDNGAKSLERSSAGHEGEEDEASLPRRRSSTKPVTATTASSGNDASAKQQSLLHSNSTSAASITKPSKTRVTAPKGPYKRRVSATKTAVGAKNVDDRRIVAQDSILPVDEASPSSPESNIIVSQERQLTERMAFEASSEKAIPGEKVSEAEFSAADHPKRMQLPEVDMVESNMRMNADDSPASAVSSASSQLSDPPSDLEETYQAALNSTQTTVSTSAQKEDMDFVAEKQVDDTQALASQASAAQSKKSESSQMVKTRSGRASKKPNRYGTLGEMTTVLEAPDTTVVNSADAPASRTGKTRKRKASVNDLGAQDALPPTKKSGRGSRQKKSSIVDKLVVKLSMPSWIKDNSSDGLEEDEYTAEADEEVEQDGSNESEDEEVVGKKATTAATKGKPLSKQSAVRKETVSKPKSIPTASAIKKKATPKRTRTKKPATPMETPTKKASARQSAALMLTPAAQTAQFNASGGLLTPPGTLPSSQEISGSSIDPQALLLSQKLTYREPVPSKPLPQGTPEVWADSRQALCETVPYFKMPQSGCHQNDHHVYSFLYDGGSRCREYMDTDVIIGGAGGGMVTDKSTGRLVAKSDHSVNESQVQAVLNDIKHENPLIIICGNKSDGAICQMPHRYNVLGWFKPIAVWAEKTMGKGNTVFTTIKYRFERLDSTQKVWHAPEQALLTEEERLASAVDLIKGTCTHCNREYPMIYLTGWMCLTAGCALFWQLPTGEQAPYGNLPYNPAFLLHRSPWQVEQAPYSVKPPALDVGHVIGDNLTAINTRGVCCPECGRCSHRRLFKGWQCDNPACTYTNFPNHIPVTPLMLHQPWENVGDGPALARNKYSGGADVSVTYLHGFKVYRYTIPGIKGAFIHAVSNKKINSLPGGPDEMFAAMQRTQDPEMDLHLQRRRFGVEKMSGGTDATVKKQPKSRIKNQATTSKLTLQPAGETRSASTLQIKQSLKEDSMSPMLPSPTAEELLQELKDFEVRKNSANGSQDIVPIISDMVASLATERSSLEQLLSGSIGAPDLTRENTTAAIVEANNIELPDECPEDTEEPQDATLDDDDQDEEKPAKKADKLEIGDYMTAFSMNYGMPYKFIAGGACLPFTNSPWPVRAARANLNWASQTLLDPTDHEDMNELLIFAYMEGQKIDYHDDGESGLGPRIATLSLGGKARMNLRMKQKHHLGCSKQGLFTEDRPVPGGAGTTIDGVKVSSEELFDRRLAAWEELQPLRTTDKAAYKRRRAEIVKELGLRYPKRPNFAKDMVNITLNHGDIVLMEGYEIQQYLEHTVVADQCLRFALTCRTIRAEHLKPEEMPSYVVEPDDLSMSSFKKMVELEAEKGKWKDVVMEG